MSDTIGNPAAAAQGSEPRREAYSFACFSCGHGWEQEYEIQRRTGLDGRTHCVYLVGGARVPSPLTDPSCPGCGGSRIRIMRAGRVAEVDTWWHMPEHPASGTGAPNTATDTRTGPDPGHPHHPHLHLPLRLRHHHPEDAPPEG